MAGIQLTGLASGLDWKSLVDQLMTVNSVPVTRLQTEQAKVGQQTTALNSLKSKLDALQESVGNLNTTGVFTQRTASASNTQWPVSASSTATAMTHTIAVTHLATTARLQGAGHLSNAIRSDGDTSQMLISAMNLAQPITAGQFSVNGARVSVAITDTLADVFQKISDATGGAVTASYDGATDRVSLASGSPIVLGSANDSSNFLPALKLNNNASGAVSSSTRLGAVKLDAPLASAGLAGSLALDGNNAGKLLLNGVEIPFDADTDSLRTVLARINSSTAGVTASYDSTNDRLVLTNKVTGDLGVSVQDSVGNLASVLGVTGAATLVRGQNAEFTVDGGSTRTSASNVLDESALGVSGLSATIGSETTERVTVGSDTASARAKIEDFISKFNEVLSYVDQQTKVSMSGTKVTTALLYGNQAARDLATGLRREVFNVLGGTGAIQRLESLGIDFNGTTNQLKIKDPARLDAGLLSKADDVTSFFTTASTGFAVRLDALIKRQTSTDGALTQAVAAKTQRSSKITTQISDLQRRLDQQRASLEARFVQMEQMQSLLKGQLQALTNAFATKSST
ncbi:MAG: flagellar hook-associated protein 2 [Chthoniobacter sp.]|jgi:flagellar hook-associated protein 2|nr:flagellar hook-associated protein 2 [Chthoniobacter sp.]